MRNINTDNTTQEASQATNTILEFWVSGAQGLGSKGVREFKEALEGIRDFKAILAWKGWGS